MTMSRNEAADRPGPALGLDQNRFADPDQAYRALIEAHRGLSDEASAALNARLVLILANELGDIARLNAALDLARASLAAPAAAEGGRHARGSPAR